MTTPGPVPPSGNGANVPRGARGRWRKCRATAERDARVAELLEAGWTFREVGRELGYSSPASVHAAWNRSLTEARRHRRGEVPAQPPRAPKAAHRERPLPDMPEDGAVVYYLQVGALVKIGHSRNLTKRLDTYPPDSQLLAIEPGGADTEMARHAQFRDLLAGRREWFHPGPPLLAHVASLG